MLDFRLEHYWNSKNLTFFVFFRVTKVRGGGKVLKKRNGAVIKYYFRILKGVVLGILNKFWSCLYI